MKADDRQELEIQALRERLTKLSEASLRINENLDFESVLQEVVDSARALSDARYAVIATLDDSGQPREFLASGMTTEERQRLEAEPGTMEFIAYLSQLREPLRVPDFPGHVRSLGLPEFRWLAAMAFLAVPVRHRGESVGYIYLARAEGGPEFTREDEESLVMFAAQAALVIANARRYRDEQRARADLEALIDTSPVGVAVMDAKTGAPVSFNREAVRILSGLCAPGDPPEQVLEVLTLLRADGRELSLGDFSMVQALSHGEVMRAEEMVFRVPDGRSVTALVNTTPIRSEAGELESVVVTLQDMTPLNELERMRAEFIAMVSHELRTPLSSIKGSTATLLNPSTTLAGAEVRQFHRIIDSQADRMRELISDLLDVGHIETGTLAVSPEPSVVAELVDQARSSFLNGRGTNSVLIDLPSNLPPVMADRQRIVQVLNNLLSNAERNSERFSAIRVAAAVQDVHVAISVSDEGRGVPADKLPYLFQKFSRIEGEEGGSAIAGTGLGLAICKGIIEAHGGRIWAESEGTDMGARFTFTIPVAEQAEPGGTTKAARSHTRPGEERAEAVRILAVDDDPHTLRHVRSILTEAGYTPTVTAEPEEALQLVEAEAPHLVLLDLVLPGDDGIDLMQRIFTIADVPVIFLSGYGQDRNIERAFGMGASDYVVKPFSPTELVARIGAALRKRVEPERHDPSEPFVLGDLTVDYAQRRVRLAGRPVHLTPTEYGLIRELSIEAGHVVTHQQLLRRVWGSGSPGDAQVVRTHMLRLRRKLGDSAQDPAYIFTEPRVGYRMAEPDTAPA